MSRLHESAKPSRGRIAAVESLEPRALFAAAPASIPFLGAPFEPGQIIEAENFDLGGQGVAYQVTKSVQVPGKAYRPADAVGVQAGGSNGYDVGYTTVGEWLQYSIFIPAPGAFSLSAAVANPASGGAFHADVDLANVTGAMAVPDTGGWQTYRTVSSPDFTLTAGEHALRVYLDHASALASPGNFDWFELSPAAPAAAVNPALHLTWKTAAPIPQGMTEGEGVTVNGKLYVFGGYDNDNYLPSTFAYSYDPLTNVWTPLKDMPVAVTNAQAAAYGAYIYIAGGYTPNAEHTYQTFSTTAVTRYDTLTNTWKLMPALPASSGAGNLAMAGETLQFFTGDNANRVDQPQHWSLDVENPQAQWVDEAPVPVPVNRAGAVALNGLIYLIGGDVGQDAQGTTQSIVRVYDPATNAWSRAAPLPTPRSRIMNSVTLYDGQIIVAGGGTFFSTTTEVDAYDPADNAWTRLSALPAPRAGGICQDIDGLLVFTTGQFGFNANTWIGTFS